MGHREQFIWKKSFALSLSCYELAQKFPVSERYELTSQIKRSCMSVSCNIAEGYGRRTKNEYVNFLYIALGSLRELDTQLLMAQTLNLADNRLFTPVMNQVEEMLRILVATINKLNNSVSR